MLKIPSTTLEKMSVVHHKRVDKYQTILCGLDRFEKIDNTTLPKGERVILGTYSRTWMKAKRRELLENATVDLGYGRCTLTDVARDYIAAKYPKRHCLREQGKRLKQYPPPFYTVPGFHSDMLHIDIRSAYFSIMKVVGWDVDYYPYQWLGVGAAIDDFPLPQDKTARNALHGCALPNQIQVLTMHGLSHFEAYNKNLNLQIHTVISNVLHEMARFAVAECGCVYVNTDGYIVPREKAIRLEAEINNWGLSFKREHEGDAVILSSGIYKIGDHASKRPESKPNKLDNLVFFPESSWLWERFHRFAKIRLKIDNQDLLGEKKSRDQQFSIDQSVERWRRELSNHDQQLSCVLDPSL